MHDTWRARKAQPHPLQKKVLKDSSVPASETLNQIIGTGRLACRQGSQGDASVQFGRYA